MFDRHTRCPTCYQPLPADALGILQQDREHADAFGMPLDLYGAAFGVEYREDRDHSLGTARMLLPGIDSTSVPAGDEPYKLTKAAATLVVAVGVRAGIALRDGLVGQDAAVWAVPSVDALATLEVPEWAVEVVVATADANAEREAAERLAERCLARKIRCRMMKVEFADVAGVPA